MAAYFSFLNTSNNGWTICPVHEMFGVPRIEGSFGVFACRMLGISFPNWLRLCQNNGAQLYGKKIRYVIPVWKEPNKEFLKMLNDKATEIAKQVSVKGLDW